MDPVVATTTSATSTAPVATSVPEPISEPNIRETLGKPPRESFSLAPKRRRLTVACNQCRRRKVRCDAEIPQCRNCFLRDEICETTDPRRPNSGPCTRRWSRRSEASSMSSSQARSHISLSASADGDTRPPLSPCSSDRTTIPHEHRRAESLSWAERAYRENSIMETDGSVKGTNDASPDVIMNIDDASESIKYVGGSNLQGLVVFIDLYLRRNGVEPISPFFRHGMSHCEEYPLLLASPLLNLPEPSLLKVYVNTFFSHIWPLFPILDRAPFEASLNRLQQLQTERGGSLQEALEVSRIPFAVIVFLVIALGADETAGGVSETGTAYLNAAYGLYGHLVAMPHLCSTQAFLLLSIMLRGRSHDGQAWQALGQAIRIAHSIGLHRQLTPRQHRTDATVRSRTWWSCYALEKMLQLQIGRPSAISDRDTDLAFPEISSSIDEDRDSHHLGAFVALTKILGEISLHIYGVPESSFSLLYETGRLDKALEDWIKLIPDYLKPGTEFFTEASHNSHGSIHPRIVSFLSIRYYEAQITLFRASMVLSEQSYNKSINNLNKQLPFNTRLLQAKEICIGAARSIVKLVLELADRNISSQLFSPTQPYLASSVIALNILVNPRKRMVRSDLELLTIATDYCEEQYRRLGLDLDFVKGCAMLRDLVRQVCDKISTPGFTSRGLNGGPSSSIIPSQSTLLVQGEAGTSQNVDVFSHNPPFNVPEQPLEFSYDLEAIFSSGDCASALGRDLDWEQLWAMMRGDVFMGDEMDIMYSNE